VTFGHLFLGLKEETNKELEYISYLKEIAAKEAEHVDSVMQKLGESK
jgi:hypothetical protein